MSIALFITGVNGGRLDRGLDARVREIRLIQNQSSRNLGELAFHVGDHHVLDFELRDGEGRVDVGAAAVVVLMVASFYSIEVSYIDIDIYRYRV